MTTGTHSIPTPSYDTSLVCKREARSEEASADVIGREWQDDLTDSESLSSAEIDHEGQADLSHSPDAETDVIGREWITFEQAEPDTVTAVCDSTR